MVRHRGSGSIADPTVRLHSHHCASGPAICAQVLGFKRTNQSVHLASCSLHLPKQLVGGKSQAVCDAGLVLCVCQSHFLCSHLPHQIHTYCSHVSGVFRSRTSLTTVLSPSGEVPSNSCFYFASFIGKIRTCSHQSIAGTSS